MLNYAKILGARLQDHWSSEFLVVSRLAEVMSLNGCRDYPVTTLGWRGADFTVNGGTILPALNT